ncbi:uncharacterized protein LOC117998054 [Mirounga leonina]|uniref:uncharacterized protein LOC117998054 n=1 Tax=Mirounga leonina TaxID=9715 RepID=UPI00156BDF89|nr:uncharacterized protein LOC117998054 [Mirounga leonina]
MEGRGKENARRLRASPKPRIGPSRATVEGLARAREKAGNGRGSRLAHAHTVNCGRGVGGEATSLVCGARPLRLGSGACRNSSSSSAPEKTDLKPSLSILTPLPSLLKHRSSPGPERHHYSLQSPERDGPALPGGTGLSAEATIAGPSDDAAVPEPLSFWTRAALAPLALLQQLTAHSTDETLRAPFCLSAVELEPAPPRRHHGLRQRGKQRWRLSGVPGPARSHTAPRNSPFVQPQPCPRLRQTPQPLSHATLPENTSPRPPSLAGLEAAWQGSRCLPARPGRPGELKDPRGPTFHLVGMETA